MDINDLKLERGEEITGQDAFIIVDMQNDFIPGGALPVEGGDKIIKEINNIVMIFNQNNGFLTGYHSKGCVIKICITTY